MSVVKRAVLLLLVAVIGANAVVIGTNAVPSPEDCDGLNKTLPAKDLHKISGDWVLVWSVSKNQLGLNLMMNLSSSHAKLRLLPDNKTVLFSERNTFFGQQCTQHVINITMHSDSDDHTLHAGTATVEEDGVVGLFNDSAEAVFYETCSDCMVLVYKGKLGQFLVIYRREGHHQDVEQLKAAHSDHRKLAECLGLPHDDPYSYKGVSEFCQKKSSPAVEPEQS